MVSQADLEFLAISSGLFCCESY